jgi:hypothetical protein
MKFVLTCQHEEHGPKITYEFNNVFLPDVLDNIQNFLKGCGFVFDGVLDIVEEDGIPMQMPHNLTTEEPEGGLYRNADDVDVDGRC